MLPNFILNYLLEVLMCNIHKFFMDILLKIMHIVSLTFEYQKQIFWVNLITQVYNNLSFIKCFGFV